MEKIHKNLLLVEGEQDKRTIPYLIEANGVNWGTKNNPVVYIDVYGGDTQLIDPVLISTELKASGRVALGMIVDADDNPLGRWQSVRNSCLSSIPDLPENLPETGLIHNTSDGIKFGVWIMPDNKMRGMLETFLAYLVPDGSEPLWKYAQEVAKEAKNKGAVYKDVHCDKAYIYTWLGWQNPPGRPPHNAIMECILDPQHPQAQTFVSWFKILYNL
ncbi:DUF3226 domain-containing protein [Lyngbya sp. PCC 8106]|uniref:DUF3226 domain-containing protein n=1 Tax=Lyngbya sp. (strain PCC 8106) TaxID=313612 RepID=UPI0000EAA948|nr:DUF3226 domain-containing protein [Lyngbya sp. PCC 8106]EAW37544.1 hypothetical protein L8106_00915 [Lyngbya sp. PCC 8106]